MRARIFNSGGIKSGCEFLVNTTTADSQAECSITALADGRFVVSCSDYSATGANLSNHAVRVQIFTAKVSKAGVEFLVNTTTTSLQFRPESTALADGRFVIRLTGANRSNGPSRAQIIDTRVGVIKSITGTVSQPVVPDH